VYRGNFSFLIYCDSGSFHEERDDHIKNGTSALISSGVAVREYAIVLLNTILKNKIVLLSAKSLICCFVISFSFHLECFQCALYFGFSTIERNNL
jgi:hypothetical protein